MQLPPGSSHESYLWGNPAFACGYLLARAFQSEGWDLNPGAGGELEGLPLHKFKEDGETAVKPCAEAWLSDRSAEALLARGFIPVQSIKGRDAVRVMRLQSVTGKALPVR